MKYYGVIFSRKTGKTSKLMQSTDTFALMKMACFNLVKGNQDAMIIDENGIIKFYLEGKANDFPTICEDVVGEKYKECEEIKERFKD